MNHENIGKFIGVILFSHNASLVWQYGRGSVRLLMDDKKIFLDRQLQLSLVLEMMNVSIPLF